MRKARALLRPMLAGAAGAGDRVIACIGALVAITLTALVCSRLPAAAGLSMAGLPMVVAPMGASAVLIFAVPASPLAQPWPVVGGNTVSALVGMAVVQVMGPSVVAAGVAVALAIGAMSLLRCLHPPGGAVALSAVVGGPAVLAAGWQFAFAPVCADALAMMVIGWAFHRFSGHAYPHRPALVQAPAPGFLPEDVDRVLAQSGEAYDIDRNDLAALLGAVEVEAERRRSGR